MDIKGLAKRLRHAADVLDELLEVQGTPAIAKKILGRPRKKPHWTQRPENQARLRKILKRAVRIKNKAAKEKMKNATA